MFCTEAMQGIHKKLMKPLFITFIFVQEFCIL